MRLVHLSDLHLGYRQYQRFTSSGINQREWDVANSFRQAIDRIIDLRPDLVVVAGDVFHTSRPTNAAILHAFRQFLRLQTTLPATRTVIIAGDHDTPRTAESGSIMGLFEQIPNVDVASSEAKRFMIPEHDLAILAVPDVPGPRTLLAPDTAAKRNVLLIHTNVSDVVPQYYAELDRATQTVSRGDLALSRWDYVALGHYHVHAKVADNAFYSGSIDYTSLNPWFDKDQEEEGRLKGKGFIEFDLETRTHTFHVLPRSREFIALREINASGKSPAEVNAAVQRAVEKVKGGIDDKVVRLVVRDIPRQVARELDHRAIREYKRRAVSFVLDIRRPEPIRRDAAGAPTRRASVADVVRAHFQTRPIATDLDRAQLVELAMKYLEEADALAGVIAAPEPEA